jgi:methionine biosynthesis protein MetW
MVPAAQWRPAAGDGHEEGHLSRELAAQGVQKLTIRGPLADCSWVPLKWRLLASLLPRDASPILDCGCGDGGFATYLRSEGWEVHGVELDEAKVAESSSRGLKVWNANLESDDIWETVGNDWGAVVFSDVLEHLGDPVRVLARSSGALRPGGGILVSLPNVGFWRVRFDLLRGRWHYADEGILDRTHRWFLTERTMLELISSAQLRVGAVSPLPTSSPGMASWYEAFWTRLAHIRPTLFALGFLWWLQQDG